MNVPPKWWAKEPQNPQHHMVVMINSLTCCGTALFYPKRSNCVKCDVIWHIWWPIGCGYDLIEHSNLFHTVDGSEIPNNHLVGCMKPLKIMGKNLPTSTGDRRISEPSTATHEPNKNCHDHFSRSRSEKVLIFWRPDGTGMDDCVFTSMKTPNVGEWPIMDPKGFCNTLKKVWHMARRNCVFSCIR